jgi:peptidoglycan hydrolase-like protein with peptidoglycan-binding domain
MVKRTAFIWLVASILAAMVAAISPAPAGEPTVSAAISENSVAATPGLVRQVQFMLLSVGFDPGPIDGVPRHLTNAAVRRFDQQSGLPVADLVSGGQISTAFLDRLRKAASGALLGIQPQPPAAGATPAPAPAPQPAAGATTPVPGPAPQPAVAAAPPPAVAAAPPHPSPPVDRFAACPFDREDFLIGGTQYTPDSFLQTGFSGSVKIAVDSLKDRLQEARQVAQQIGGPALKEVQRQAKVLSYFECRLKIEQGAATKN